MEMTHDDRVRIFWNSWPGRRGQDQQTGKAYLRFSARDGDGETAQWITVMYFGADAAELVSAVEKGARIYCEGKLELSEWTDRDGKTRPSLTVMSFHVRPAKIGRRRERKVSENSNAGPPQRPASNDFHSDDIPW